MHNRSVPVDTLLPHVYYQDLVRASDWLRETFGFTENYRYGQPVSGVQLRLGAACLMLKQAPPGSLTPAELGYGTQSLTVFVDNVRSHFERTARAGAQIVEPLHETIYGELQYGVVDIEGHHWLFSEHVRDRDPRDWGAEPSEG